MSLTAEERSPTAKIKLPEEVDWEMLDKWRFFVLGSGIFSGVSAALYPAVVIKTRLQCSSTSSPPLSSCRAATAILRHHGPFGFYRGFATSLAGTVPARALYMAALELTKSAVASAASRLDIPDPGAAATAAAVAGLSAAMAAQLVWTPIDVITQRLMVQSSQNPNPRYVGGIDAFAKILKADGVRGLYRGFGLSILAYAPSNAVWWASYSLSQPAIWRGIGWCMGASRELSPDQKTVVAVQGASAAMAGGAACLVTMPLDTVKTRLQVMEGGGVGRTMRRMVNEGGWGACYRGFGPRWAAMSLSATTMITAYEFLKQVSAKGRKSVPAAAV